MPTRTRYSWGLRLLVEVQSAKLPIMALHSVLLNRLCHKPTCWNRKSPCANFPCCQSHRLWNGAVPTFPTMHSIDSRPLEVSMRGGNGLLRQSSIGSIGLGRQSSIGSIWQYISVLLVYYEHKRRLVVSRAMMMLLLHYKYFYTGGSPCVLQGMVISEMPLTTLQYHESFGLLDKSEPPPSIDPKVFPCTAPDYVVPDENPEPFQYPWLKGTPLSQAKFCPKQSSTRLLSNDSRESSRAPVATTTALSSGNE